VTHLFRRALATGLMLMAGLAQSAIIEGQTFADRIRLAGADLTLNGVGLRAVAWFKGYAAGLYLLERANTPDAVIAQRGPKRVQLKMMVDVGSEEFRKAYDKGMKRNLATAEYEAMKERIEAFSAAIGAIGPLKKGDVIDLDFVPGQGLQLGLNGERRGATVPGADLYAGLLKIFVGPLPVDKRLKAGLLGAG
jgi:hypothetical protein